MTIYYDKGSNMHYKISSNYAPNFTTSKRIKNNIITMVYRHIHGNLIVIVTKDVKNTDNGTFPPFMCDSNPETCPPGTIKTITADTANKELLNISATSSPTAGSKISLIQIP